MALPGRRRRVSVPADHCERSKSSSTFCGVPLHPRDPDTDSPLIVCSRWLSVRRSDGRRSGRRHAGRRSGYQGAERQIGRRDDLQNVQKPAGQLTGTQRRESRGLLHNSRSNIKSYNNRRLANL